jgi:hypothetical protein
VENVIRVVANCRQVICRQLAAHLGKVKRKPLVLKCFEKARDRHLGNGTEEIHIACRPGQTVISDGKSANEGIASPTGGQSVHGPLKGLRE